MIAIIYGPNVDDSDFFRNMFDKLNDFSKNEILVGGDFNMTLTTIWIKLMGRLIRTNWLDKKF